MKQLKIIFIVIILSFVGLKILTALFMTDYYSIDDNDALQINVAAEQNWGVAQASGYYVHLDLSNSKTQAKKSYELASDCFGYAFYKGVVEYKKKQRKILLVQNLRYENYNVYDYKSLNEIEYFVFEYSGGWSTLVGSNDTTWGKTKEDLFNQLSSEPFGKIGVEK
ncbi:MAG: hypothetical protein HRT58_12175 [Crocinitomicaceae bacterium]|nr:hypothetical protein [Flavobacteriales bacterium]NQZ36418.1 hypothetical protein [Crocinitomicaceae bacterium]